MPKKKPAKRLRRKRQVKGKRHDTHIKVYMSKEEKQIVESFCAAQGESASGWLSDLAHTEVRRIQASQEREKQAS